MKTLVHLKTELALVDEWIEPTAMQKAFYKALNGNPRKGIPPDTITLENIPIGTELIYGKRVAR